MYFPYAGASTVSFKNIATYFSEGTEVICYEYPGHGKRIEEPFAGSVTELAEEALSKVPEGIPVYLSGHCLGVLVAYEVSLLMRDSGYGNAARLIISGQCPPDRIVSENLEKMTDDELLEYLAEHSLIDRAMTDPKYRKFVADLILKPIKKDSDIYNSYTYRDVQPLEIPVDILYGSEDGRFPVSELERWSEYTGGDVSLLRFEGDHYFLKKYEKEYFSAINAIIERDKGE